MLRYNCNMHWYGTFRLEIDCATINYRKYINRQFESQTGHAHTNTNTYGTALALSKWTNKKKERMKEKAQRPHTTISHTFIGVMPIVASCWQNEFPRNLFALKTCNKRSTTQSHTNTNTYAMHIEYIAWFYSSQISPEHGSTHDHFSKFVFAEFLIYYQRLLSCRFCVDSTLLLLRLLLLWKSPRKNYEIAFIKSM